MMEGQNYFRVVLSTLVVLLIFGFGRIDSDDVLAEETGTEIDFSTEIPLDIMATGVKDSIVISFRDIEHADGYELYESIDGESFTFVGEWDRSEIVLDDKGFNETYVYYVRGYMDDDGTKIYSEESRNVSATTAPEGAKSTIKTLFQTGIAPMGHTMYIWGGGWNEADDGSGPTTMQIGVAKEWRDFALDKDNTYDFQNYRYQIHDGLDCSGYLGFINYNILNTASHNEGYVTWAADTGPYLNSKGLGTYTEEQLHNSYTPGDVMYNEAHVYLVIGRASDNSILMMHASPDGVKLSGTPTPSGESSEAARLASEYTAKYFPEYYEKDDVYLMSYSFLNSYKKFQYDSALVADPDGYKQMSAEEILEDLFSER
ncbi:hypothetical protein [Aliicoccus persicus]